MDVNLEGIWKMFRESLVVLSLPPEEQRRVNGPGCLACDLLVDFGHWRETFLAHFGGVVTPAQRAMIVEMDAIIGAMDEADRECWNDEVVQRPVWESLRTKAKEALRMFGSEGQAVKPFVEVQPGVWHRPAPE
jgi:hypothetical protein